MKPTSNPKERPRPTWLKQGTSPGGQGGGTAGSPRHAAMRSCPSQVWETGCLCREAGAAPRGAPPRAEQQSLEDTDPKGGGRKPKLGAASKFWGTGGAGPGPRDCSPCLAPWRPLGLWAGGGAPQVGPEAT